MMAINQWIVIAALPYRLIPIIFIIPHHNLNLSGGAMIHFVLEFCTEFPIIRFTRRLYKF